MKPQQPPPPKEATALCIAYATVTGRENENDGIIFAETLNVETAVDTLQY